MLIKDLPLSSETIMGLISPFYHALLLSLFLTASGSSITLLNTPSLLCVQDTVQFSCTVTAPGFIYESTNAGLNINSSINCVSAGHIGAGTAPRLSVMSTGGTLSAPSAQYTISPFLLQDNMTQYRCCANNASNFAQDFTDYISLPLAAPPSRPTITTISSTYDSATSCYGTITLTWLAVTSDRAVISYEVYLNGTNLDGTTGNSTYTTGSLNLLEHYANYTVVATSCAGSSMASSPVMFTALTPALPSATTSLNISSTYYSATSCTGTITLTWLAVASDRAVTSYEVLLNGTVDGTTGTTTFNTGTLNLIEHYATYTVRTINCVGSGMTSSPIMFTPLTPASPSAASISISTTYASATSCTGTVSLTWPAVASDRAVTIYEVLLNGTTNVMTLSPTVGTNTYTTSSLSLATFNARYTVRVVSCAGSSVSNEVVFTPPTTPSTPVIAIPPTITSLQPSSCTARIEFTLQQPADSVTSYHLSTASTVIQSLPADPNNVYSFYYDIILNTTASLYITAENCVGNSSQLQTSFPTLQGVSGVEVTGAVINTNINLEFKMLFTDTSSFPVAVKFKVFAITTFTDGPIDTDIRSIYSGVQNSGTMYNLTAPIPYLVSGTPLALNSNVQSISIVVSTNSICGQALLLSSRYVHIDLTGTPTTAITSTESFTTPSTTLAILPTTPTSATTNNVNYVSSSSSPVPDCPTYCPCTTCNVKITNTPILSATTNYTPITTGSSLTNDATSDTLSCNTTPYLVGIIILVLLLLLSILIIAILILFIIYSSKKNNSAPKNQQITNTDDPTNTAHIYNYIDLNALAETNEEKHYYSDMAAIVQSNASTTATTASNTNPTTASTTTTNDNTNDRTGYYNVSTYANLS